MNEKTPLLYNMKRLDKKIINKGKITCKDDKNIEIIEIISNKYNLNYYFDITVTNCKRIKKVGTTIHGIIIKVNKANIKKPCEVKWTMIHYL